MDTWVGPTTCACAKECDDAGLAQFLFSCFQVRPEGVTRRSRGGQEGVQMGCMQVLLALLASTPLRKR
eukprot:7587714-Pyramimonas_sp.AAC.1